jgi:anti-sigma B factor antagonist
MSPAIVSEPAPPTADLAVSMAVHADDVAHSATIVLGGEVDLAVANTLAATLEDQQRRARRHVRLDVSDVTFMDATALSVLVDAHFEFLTHRGTLTLTGVGRPVSRLLSLTGLGDVLLLAGSNSPLDERGRPATRHGLRPVAV